VKIENKLALVTGAGIRLGKAMAIALADAGMNVAVHYAHSGHEVMRSAEPGERWRWCFVDEITG